MLSHDVNTHSLAAIAVPPPTPPAPTPPTPPPPPTPPTPLPPSLVQDVTVSHLSPVKPFLRPSIFKTS